MGCGEPFTRWKAPEDVFDSLREISRGQPCDLTGIEGYRMLDEQGGLQWPAPEGAAPFARERRLFEDGRFYRADGRALFAFEHGRPLPEPVDPEYPLVLLTGRGSSSQWHTLTRTDRSPVLRRLAPAGIHVEIHPEDASRLGVEAGERVALRSRRGRIEARAVVTASVGVGRVFVPMHYAETNDLTRASFDPYSRQPSYKHCAVRIEQIV